MKTHRTTAFAALLMLIIPAATILANPPRFAITKTTSDGGGGRSADVPEQIGGTPRFTLTGTIGQPDAAPRLVSASSRFAIQPGFWSEYTLVQLPAGPQLLIRKGAPGFFVLAWPVSVQGYILEQSPDLTPASWTNVTNPVVDTATEHTVTVPVTGPRMFFRLKQL